jgi:hypothetical protein
MDPVTGISRPVGIFNSVSLGLTYDAQPAFILGRYSPAEIDYVAQEPIPVSLSGWRVFDHGAHLEALVPSLDQLMNHEYLTITLVDRQNPSRAVGVVRGFRPTGYTTNVSARGLVEMTVNGMGLLLDDESTINAESPGALSLP